ncbi:MAG: hypothetical protein ACN6PN_09735, partial [Sphingobacterium sp.]
MKIIKRDILSTRMWNYLGVLSFLLYGISCSTLDLDSYISNSNKYQVLDQLSSPVINGFAVDSKSNVPTEDNTSPGSRKRAASSTPTAGVEDPPRLRAGTGGTSKAGPDSITQRSNPLLPSQVLLTLHRRYKANMFTIADGSMALNIFPGAILDGRSLEGNFSPQMLQGISSGIRPITISTSLPVSGYAVAKTAIARPTAGIALVNAALTDLEKVNPGEVGAASLDVSLDTFRVYEELKTSYGYQKGLDAFL